MEKLLSQLVICETTKYLYFIPAVVNIIVQYCLSVLHMPLQIATAQNEEILMEFRMVSVPSLRIRQQHDRGPLIVYSTASAMAEMVFFISADVYGLCEHGCLCAGNKFGVRCCKGFIAAAAAIVARLAIGNSHKKSSLCTYMVAHSANCFSDDSS